MHAGPVKDGERFGLGMTCRKEAAYTDMGHLGDSLSYFRRKRAKVGGRRSLFHPNYNLNAKKAKGIPEFYDYDVALIKLTKKLKYETTIR